MNKNLFKTFAIAAIAVLAGACAKEQVGPGDGETTEVSFNVEVPGASVATKGISDAASVDELVFQAFLYRKYKDAETNKDVAEYIPVPELTKVVPVADKKANVTASLVKGQMYSFIFWAQKRGTGYYNVNTNEPSAIDLRTITLNYANVKTNDALLDAFYAVIDIKSILTIKPNVTLKRALAQINFGSEQSNRQDAKVSQSSITLKNVPTTFHPLLAGTRSACDNFSEKNIVLSYNDVMTEKLSVNSVNYDYLATTYVFAPKNDPILVDASAVFKFETGKTTNVKVPNVSVKQNFRTNIVGNLLLANAEWNVIINPDFQSGDIAYDAVSAGLAKGTTVTLSEDYFVADKSKGVTLDVGVTSVLNLNGKKFSNENGLEDNKAALQVHGDLTINGDGEVYCKGGADNNAIIVEQGGHLVINGGTYNVGANSGKSNATIFVMGPDKYGRNGSVEINGGVFMAEAGSDSDATPATPFVLNQHDDITVKCFSVKGGTFVGFNPASVHEAHGAITSFVAEGYKSVKISESPDTWQVVDASKTISDQAGLNSALGEASTGDYLKLPAGTYTLPELTKKSVEGVTFEGKLGADGNPLTVIDLASVAYTPSDNGRPYKDVTFKNISFITWTDNYKGFRHSENLLFEGCTFTGKHFAYGKETYKKCKFIQNVVDYNIWTYGSEEITFNECLFDCQGKAVLIYNEKNQNPTPEHPEITEPFKINFNKCTFTAHAKATSSEGKTYGAIEIDSSISSPFNITITDCTSTGFSYDSAIYHVKKHKYNVSIVIDSNSVYNE